MNRTAIDLGHHQVFAALGDTEALEPLGNHGDGLVVRWCEADRPAERLHDRLARLVAAGNVRGAAETAAAIADCLAEILPDEANGSRLRVAVPLTASPGHRAHLRTAFGNAGFTVEEHDLIGRPYAALGQWLSVEGHRRNGLPRGKTLILDNDAGRVSALVVDIARCSILAEGQITTSSVPDVARATLALRRLLEASYSSLGDAVPVPWSVLSASIAEVVASGSGAQHPAFTKFVSERFPASTLHDMPGPGHEVIVRGIHHVDRFVGYRSSWPTLDICFDGRVVRPAGSWSMTDASPTVAPVGTQLSFGNTPVVLRAAPNKPDDDIVLADAAIGIPERVGPFPLMSVHPSGSIEIRGTDASIRLHLDWPVAGSTCRPLTVVVEDILDLTIDRTPFTPRGDPPHRATGGS